jgi:hypothetical protein
MSATEALVAASLSGLAGLPAQLGQSTVQN